MLTLSHSGLPEPRPPSPEPRARRESDICLRCPNWSVRHDLVWTDGAGKVSVFAQRILQRPYRCIATRFDAVNLDRVLILGPGLARTSEFFEVLSALLAPALAPLHLGPTGLASLSLCHELNLSWLLRYYFLRGRPQPDLMGSLPPWKSFRSVAALCNAARLAMTAFLLAGDTLVFRRFFPRFFPPLPLAITWHFPFCLVLTLS